MVPLEMRVMLKFFGTVQVDEPAPHHLDHLEMPMIPSSLVTTTHLHRELHHLLLDQEEDFPHSQADLVHLPLVVEEHPFLVMVLSLLTLGGKVRSKS
jgi:hypothetical protein